MELIVIIAILAIMIGMFLMTSGVLATRAGKQCTAQIKHEIEKVRVSTMGKNEVTLHIYARDGKVWVTETTKFPKIGGKGVDTVTSDEKEIGSARVSVQVKSDKTSDYRDLDSVGINIAFNRSTGAFAELDASGDQFSGDVSGKHYIESIKIRGGNQIHTLNTEKVTGKVLEE